MPWPNQKLTSPISVAKKPKQSRSCTTAEEALDPDANYTEYKGDFEIPTDVPDEDEARTNRAPNPSDFKAAFSAVHIAIRNRLEGFLSQN